MSLEGQTLLPGESSGSSGITTDDEESGCCGATACCNPRSVCHRFMAGLLMCFLGFGSYFCYDNPGALQDNFMKDLNITTTEFMFLYSIYSWPNVILCFVGGFLIDSVFGVRNGSNIYMLIVMIGQIIFASAGFYDMYWLMIVGRLVFGIGAESLAVAQNNYAVVWFRGKELNMVFGIQLSFARIGSTVNFWIMEPVYTYVQQFYNGPECIGVVLFLAGLTCVFSMICSLILGCMDKRAARILHRDENNTEVVRLKDVFDFKTSFWLITLIVVAYYVAIFPFIALGKKFFMTKFNFSPHEANNVNSIVYFISAIASPILGLLIDKTGRNIIWVLSSIIFTIAAHAILTFTDLSPYIGVVIMGLAYSLCASGLWPLVALVIPEYQLGTAYGLCQSIENLGLAVVSIVTGIIVDSGGYYWVEIFFMGALVVALFCTILVWIIDSRAYGIMNMTPYERDIHDCNRQAAEILEREKLLASNRSQIGPNDLLQPTNSEFHIRNRYLSRIGASLPSHYNVNQKYLAYRAHR